MRVQHSVYGQGVVISTDGQISKVHFDAGFTKDVNANELAEVIFGI